LSSATAHFKLLACLVAISLAVVSHISVAKWATQGKVLTTTLSHDATNDLLCHTSDIDWT